MCKHTPYISIMGAILLFAPMFAFAEGQAAPELAPRSYLFYLNYDNGALSLRASLEFPYDLPIEHFTQGTVDAKTAYRGEIINMRNEVVSTFFFDPKRGKPADFSKGEIEVRAPYFADALKVNFSDNQGRPFLTVPVEKTSFCDDDGACEADFGENARTCPYDCRHVETPVFSASAEPLTPAGVVSRSSRIGIILAGAGIVVCLAGLWIIRKKS